MLEKICLILWEALKKELVIASFASNVARMETAFYCAEKTGRQISLVGRSMHRIFKAARQCGYSKKCYRTNRFPREAKKIAREKIVYLMYRKSG